MNVLNEINGRIFNLHIIDGKTFNQSNKMLSVALFLYDWLFMF